MADLFAGQPPSLQDMLGCARRELGMRRKVYPRWVAKGTMTRGAAEREIAVMEAIVDHFERAAHG